MGRFVLVGTIVFAACGRIGFDEGVTPGVGETARASFSVGDRTACAVRAGDVYCWGERENGQAGAGTNTIPALVPVKVPGIPKATQIGVGSYHACIITVDATVWCWGGDEYGRLGNVPGGPATDPAVVPLPARATEISVAKDTGCVVLETGAVWCWGLDDHGQLGRGTTMPDDQGNAPGPVLGISDAVHVSVADDSACAVRASGQVMCWGENGRGLIDTTGNDVTTPREVADLAGATAIAVGGDHVCALIGRRVGCRGLGTDGQLGNGVRDDSTTVVFSTLDDYVTLDASYTHTCAVRENGSVMCWGANDGVLGDGTREWRTVPTQVANLDDALAVATDENSTCALRADERITCWGWGPRGLLGDGRSAVLSAERAPTVSNAGSIALGSHHTCATDGAQVLCWGANGLGQLGVGTTSDAMATPQVVSFAWPGGIPQLVAGETHTCARVTNGNVYCWGDNSLGQLGDGTATSHTMPTLVPLPMPTIQLVAGTFHTCALGSDMALRCWGRNQFGQIGDGTTMQRETPVSVANNVAEAAAGDSHTCIRSGPNVSCWGGNDQGQIGDGTFETRPSAVVVSGVAATNIMAGGASTCARTSSGTIVCWGLNDSGMLLIDGAPYDQLTPGTSMQTELFALGYGTGCMRDMCWGQNGLGQLGAGTFGYFNGPTATANLPAAAATNSQHDLSASHACAIVPAVGGGVWCWGENAFGEIGNGAVTTALFPATTVAFP